MAREILLVAATSDSHYLLFGLDDSSLSSFSIQMWIEKFGHRMIDFCQSMGLNFITFMGSDLYIHNQDDADQDRCKLFGEKKDCIVGVVANEQGNKIKLYDALGVHTDHEWEVTDIYVSPSLNYPQGMYSKIPAERFKKRGMIWRATFLRNMYTNSSTASVIDAINGDPLRGYDVYMLLKNTDNDQVKLFGVTVETTLSKV
jgi:hypothetical protein